MPFTPLHAGPGLLLKAAGPAHFSLAAFLLVQVAIDVETLYHLVRGDAWVHRQLHTALGSLAAAAACALAWWLVRRPAGRLVVRVCGPLPGSWLRAEGSALGVILGAWLGAWSHVALDAVMHADLRPFLPWATANPLLDVIHVAWLHVGCLIAGVVGAAVLLRGARQLGTKR